MLDNAVDLINRNIYFAFIFIVIWKVITNKRVVYFMETKYKFKKKLTWKMRLKNT